MPDVRAKMPDGSVQTFASVEEAKAAAEQMRTTSGPANKTPSTSSKIDALLAVVPFPQGMREGLQFAKQELTDPENLSTAGGALGGIGGGLLTRHPAGAAAGATLGGTLASRYGEGNDWGAALKEGATEGTFEGVGGALAKLLKAIGKPAMRGGKALVRHAFGPQARVANEFGESVRGDALEALTDLKLKETPILAPVGGRTAPHLIQNKIQREGIDPRNAIMAGPAGDRAAAPKAAFNPVVTHEGETVNPLKAVFDRAFGQTNPRSDLKSIGNVVRGATSTPTGAGPGRATINNPRMMVYAERTVPGTLPPLPPDTERAGYQGEVLERIRKALNLDQPLPDTSLFTPKMRESIPVRDMQEMVTGNYRKLDDAGAFVNEPSPSASRDALKGITRGLKEETQRVVPEVVPLNKRMSELIPLREALIQAEAQGHSQPFVRLGETLALGGGKPGMALGSSGNRPRVQSMGGQALYEAGKALRLPRTGQGVATLSPQLLRLLQTIYGGTQ